MIYIYHINSQNKKTKHILLKIQRFLCLLPLCMPLGKNNNKNIDQLNH